MSAAERVALVKAVAWPGPGELADYLVGKRKAKEQFAKSNGARCCLGHYAEMCGLDYPNDQPDFNGASDYEDGASLPEGHWLLAKATPLKEFIPADGSAYTPCVDSALAYLNDHSPRFDKVIEALRKLEAKS